MMFYFGRLLHEDFFFYWVAWNDSLRGMAIKEENFRGVAYHVRILSLPAMFFPPLKALSFEVFFF